MMISAIPVEAVLSRHVPMTWAGDDIERLVQEHRGYIEAAAKRVLGPNYAQALDDLRQEVCIAIWRALERGESIHQWKAFIYHCAHKRALDLFRQTRRRARREVSLGDLTRDEDQNGEDQLPAVSAHADDLDEALTVLEEELVKLPPPVRLTVLLRKGEGYSRTEVAQMLNCSPATVDYRLRQGVRHLRKRLKQRGYTTG